MLEREDLDRMLRLLGQTSLGDALILVGSAAWEDLVADAQSAFVGLQDPVTVGYEDYAESIARGYEILLGIRRT